jgi:hypothetical protein
LFERLIVSTERATIFTMATGIQHLLVVAFSFTFAGSAVAQQFTTTRSKSEFVINTQQWGSLWFDASNFDNVTQIGDSPMGEGSFVRGVGFRTRHSFYEGVHRPQWNLRHYNISGVEWQLQSYHPGAGSSWSGSNFHSGYGTARGPDNRLYVVDALGSHVYAFGDDKFTTNAEGQVVNEGPRWQQFLSHSASTPMMWPYDIAFDPITLEMAVAQNNGQVQIYYGTTHVRTINTGVSTVRGVTYDPAGYVATGANGESVIRPLLYVSDRGGHRILRFDALSGQGYGSDPDDRENPVFVASQSGGLTAPYSLRFSPDDGYLYVVGESGVYRFTPHTGTPAGPNGSALLPATSTNHGGFEYIAFRVPEQLYDFHQGGYVLLDNQWLQPGTEAWFKAAMDQQLRLQLEFDSHNERIRFGTNVQAHLATGKTIATPAVELTGGAGLFALAGSGVIAPGGGNVIAPGGGNIIARDGAGLIGQAGGNVIAAGGGNIIARDGAGLIGQAGGNVIAPGGGNRSTPAPARTSGSRTPPAQRAGGNQLLTGDFTVAGDYTQSAGTDLFLTIGGTTYEEQGVKEYDRFTVGGTAHLAGRIVISLIDHNNPDNWQRSFWMPQPGDTFDILTASEILEDRVALFSLVRGIKWSYSIVPVAGGKKALRLVVDEVPPPLTPFEQWAQARFGFHGVPAAAPHWDYDGDGLSTLLEYALNSDPLAPSTAALPRPERRNIDGTEYLVLPYQRDVTKTDIRYEAESTSNFVSWSEVTNDVVVNSTGTIEYREARMPATGAAMFMRLRVSMNSGVDRAAAGEAKTRR